MTGNSNDPLQNEQQAEPEVAAGLITTDQDALESDQQRLDEAAAAEAARRHKDALDRLNEEVNDNKKDESFTPTSAEPEAPAAEDEEQGEHRKEPVIKDAPEAEMTEDGDKTDPSPSPAAPPPYDPALIEALCALYNIPEIPENFMDNMGGMTAHYIMPDEKDARTPVMIAVLHDDAVMEVTQSRVITPPGLTAQTAYDMAMLAALNPKMMEDGVTLLPGSDEDRVLLYHAAKAFGLTVSNEHELTPEQRANPPESWKALLAEKGMPLPEETEEDDLSDTSDQDKKAPEAGYEHTGAANSAPAVDVFDMTGGAPALPDGVPQIDTAETTTGYPLYDDAVLNGTYPEPQDQAMPEEAPEVTEDPQTAPETPEEPEAPKESEVVQDAGQETRTAADVKKAPVSGQIITDLFNANVDKETYLAARTLVIDEQKASRSTLKKAFNDLSDRQIKAVQACLRAENIIAKQGANKHVVLVQP